MLLNVLVREVNETERDFLSQRKECETSSSWDIISDEVWKAAIDDYKYHKTTGMD